MGNPEPVGTWCGDPAEALGLSVPFFSPFFEGFSKFPILIQRIPSYRCVVLHRCDLISSPKHPEMLLVPAERLA